MAKLDKTMQDTLDAYCDKSAEKGRAESTKQAAATSMMEQLGPLLTESILDEAVAKAKAKAGVR